MRDPSINPLTNFAQQAKRRGQDHKKHEQRESLTSRLEELSKILREGEAIRDGFSIIENTGRILNKIKSMAEILFPMERGINKVRHRYGNGVATYFMFTHDYVWNNHILFIIWFALVLVPWYSTYESENLKLDATETLKNFIGANGVTSTDKSWFYYSGYKPTMGDYDMRSMYTVAILLSIMLQSLVAAYKVGGAIGRVTMESHDPNLNIVLSIYGYDFGITDPTTNDLMLSSIQQQIRTLISLHERRDRQKSLEQEALNKGFCCSRKCFIISRRIVGVFATVAVLVASNFSLFIIIDKEAYLNSIFSYLVTLLVSSLQVVSPILIRRIVVFERYLNPLAVIYNCVGRTYFIKMSNVGFLMYQIYDKSNDSSSCVETETGSLLLQLIVIDLMVTVIGYAITTFASRCWFRLTNGQPSDFLLSDNMLELIYSQSLIWLCSVVCPMIYVIGGFAHTIRFFGKKFVLFKLFPPPKNLLHTSDDAYFFHLLFLVTLLLSFLPIGYFLGRESNNCGPHINGTALSGVNFLADDLGPASQGILFILNPMVLGFFIILLFMFVFVLSRQKKREAALHKLRYDRKAQEARAFKNLLQEYVYAQEGFSKDEELVSISLSPFGERNAEPAFEAADQLSVVKSSNHSEKSQNSKVSAPIAVDEEVPKVSLHTSTPLSLSSVCSVEYS